MRALFARDMVVLMDNTISSQPYRIVFMGTPDFARDILEALLDSQCDESGQTFEIVAVYSRVDAVSKRGKAVTPSPVSQLALERDIPLFRPATLRDEVAQEELRELAPDLIVVAAYGMILPSEVLGIPPLGCVNVHASLLPRWRGAAPIERAILEGDEYTGVSIMQMEEGLDTGPYCAIAETDIADKSAPELHKELAELGGRLLLDSLPEILDGSAQWTVQDDSKVTYAHKIEKSEMKLSPELTAEDFVRRVRASSESAPARLSVEGRGVRVLQAIEVNVSQEAEYGGTHRVLDPLFQAKVLKVALRSALRYPHTQPPASLPKAGRIVLVKHQGERYVLLACADSPDALVELITVKPDGKRAMAAADWFNGFPKQEGGLSWD